MHIPDGFLSFEVNAATTVASVVCCAVAIRHANRTLTERQIPMLGVAGAFIFAAQMLNFPIAGGTSGHFLGSVLAAVLLGPLNACLVMAMVFAIQCLVFADGGLTALGANIFNASVIGALLGYPIFSGLRGLLPKTQSGFIAAAGAASWASIVLASAACVVELSLSGMVPLMQGLASMTAIHGLIGIGEALITMTVLTAVLGTRPDLVAPRYQLASA